MDLTQIFAKLQIFYVVAQGFAPGVGLALIVNR